LKKAAWWILSLGLYFRVEFNLQRKDHLSIFIRKFLDLLRRQDGILFLDGNKTYPFLSLKRDQIFIKSFLHIFWISYLKSKDLKLPKFSKKIWINYSKQRKWWSQRPNYLFSKENDLHTINRPIVSHKIIRILTGQCEPYHLNGPEILLDRALASVSYTWESCIHKWPQNNLVMAFSWATRFCV